MAGEPQPKQPVGFGLPKRRSGLRQVGRRGRAKRASTPPPPEKKTIFNQNVC